MTKISKNQMSLRYNGDKFIAVKSQSSDCNNCAFFCCELEDEKQETFCNPSNRDDGEFVVWIRQLKGKRDRPNETEIDLVYETIKKMELATISMVSDYLDIGFGRVKKSFEQLQLDGKIEKYKVKYRIK